jgi:hypothetical protein
MIKTPQNIIDEQTLLEEDRKPYESLKQICVDFAYPGRSSQWDLFGINDEGKQKRGRKIYDPTAGSAFEIWSKGIVGHFMPMGINWFAEQMADKKLRDSKRVRQWLQDTDEHMQVTLNQSNYHDQKLVKIQDGGCIGDAFMYIEQDDQTGKQMMLCPHPREFWVRRDFWGRVSCIHHKFQKTLRDIQDEFGNSALSEDQRLTLETQPNSKIFVIHGIYKNKDYNPEQAGVKNMPWQHYYVNVEKKMMMEETGSMTLNPVPWSLYKPTHEIYGRGVIAQMLIEIITVNLMGKDMLNASQIAVSPPMLLPEALRHKVDMRAGGKTFVGSREMQGLRMGDLVSRMIDSSGYPFGIDNHSRWQQMIEDRLGKSLFLALNMAQAQGYKNIEHIRGAQAERAVLMAPFLNNLSVDTDSELDRVYSIELGAGYIGGRWTGRAPEPPPEVMEAQNGMIDIQYIGPLNQVLKQYYETGNLLYTIANIQQVLSVAPDSMVVVEGDELMRKILQSGNTPEELILSREDVTEIKAIAAQREEDAILQQQMAQTAKMVPDLSKKIESDSVLKELMKDAA